MTVKRCSAKDCVSSGTPCSAAFLFKFPRDLERCAAWVKNSGNEKLLLAPSRRLCVRNYLCADHFEERQFFDKFKRRLKRNAIPTIFSSMPLSEESMSKFPILEDPHNAADAEERRSSLSSLFNKYNSFPLHCSREIYSRADALNRSSETVTTRETECTSSVAETILCIDQDNATKSNQKEADNVHTVIRIPSCESSTGGVPLMPGPGSITYIEGPWSNQPEVDTTISVETFDNLEAPKELLTEHSDDSQYEEIVVHHVDVKTDKNFEDLCCETHVVPSTIPCDRENYGTNDIQFCEFPILESSHPSPDAENNLPPSSSSTEKKFVIQSKLLTNGGQVCVRYTAANDLGL